MAYKWRDSSLKQFLSANIDGWEQLRNCIIIQAVKDWVALCDGEISESANCNLIELRNYFEDDCGGLLSDSSNVSGVMILKELELYRIEKGVKG